jgi:hypothetical protein
VAEGGKDLGSLGQRKRERFPSEVERFRDAYQPTQPNARQYA